MAPKDPHILVSATMNSPVKPRGWQENEGAWLQKSGHKILLDLFPRRSTWWAGTFIIPRTLNFHSDGHIPLHKGWTGPLSHQQGLAVPISLHACQWLASAISFISADARAGKRRLLRSSAPLHLGMRAYVCAYLVDWSLTCLSLSSLPPSPPSFLSLTICLYSLSISLFGYFGWQFSF